MVFEFRTTKRAIEAGYIRGTHFYLKLPILGTVEWTHFEGWKRYSGK